jgi:hypothetical protein
LQHPPQGPKIKHPTKSPNEVRRSLANAWGTELLLYLGHHFLKSEEIVRVSNTWNVVQAYYALYHATQAIGLAKGFKRPETHPRTQALFLELWGKLPESFLPWCFVCKSDGHHLATTTIDHKVHVWSIVDAHNCHSLAYKGIRTTRDEAILERYQSDRETKKRALVKKWEGAEKARIEKGRKARPKPKFPLPRLTAEEQKNAQNAVRGYSMLDYLYRLRIRTNYVDAANFH